MLYSSSLILLTIGVYLIVNTFRRFEKRPSWLTQFAVEKSILARVIGSVLIVVSFYILRLDNGFWVTFFMWLNGLTLVLMMIVILNPISILKMRHAYLIFGIIIMTEILLTYAR